MPLDGLEPLARRSATAAAGPRDAVVWAVRLDCGPSDLERHARLLSPDERGRADRLRRPADRARFIAGRAQLRQVLGCRLGLDPASIRFDYSPTGKPALSDRAGAPRLHFNASGSESLGLVALRDDSPVGIDLERIRPMADAESLAARILSADEMMEFGRLAEPERARRFFDCWVRKEALAKSLGSGLREALDRLSLHPWPADRACHVTVSRDTGMASLWVAPLAVPEGGYAGAIASERPLGIVDVRWWTPQAAG